jgi:ketosteroid isomerase-like protein
LTASDRPDNPQKQVIIDDRKLDYLFDRNIQPDDHNSSRAEQNARQLKRLGFYDDPESRQTIDQHLQQTVQTDDNVIQQFTHQYRDRKTGEVGESETEVRDSLLAGRSGKFAQLHSSWQVLPEETRRFLSAILYGR